MMKAIFPNLGDEKIAEFYRLVTSWKMTISDFNKALGRIAQEEKDKEMESKFEEMFVKLNGKYNNNRWFYG